MEKIEQKTFMLLGVFIAALVLGNILGIKIATLFGISFSVGIFAYPITFLCTDIIEEVRGKAVTMIFVKTGIIVLFLTGAMIALSVILPPADRFTNNPAYVSVFSSTYRILLASLIAFAVAQYHDIWAFNFWKQKTKGKHLWLRNNLSTIVSQLIDTVLFMFIAFYQMTPKFTVGFVISLIIPYYLLKIAMALFDTPFVYLGVKWLKS